MRHLGWLFGDLGLDQTDKPTRKRVQAALVEELGVSEEAHCPEIWAATKERFGLVKATDQSAELVAVLGERLEG